MESIQEITLFIPLTVGWFCPILLTAFDLPSGQKSPVKICIPPGDSCCQEAFHDFWPIFFPLTFNTTGLAWWDQMFGRRFGTEPRKRKLGTAMEHISTATSSSEHWEKGETRQGSSLEVPGGQGCVTCWRNWLPGAQWNFRGLWKAPLPVTSPTVFPNPSSHCNPTLRNWSPLSQSES